MNFTELKAELAARGFDYLSDARLGQYINWANGELDDAELWPYRRITGDGQLNAGNYQATDGGVVELGTVAYVLNITGGIRKLEPTDLDTIYEYGGQDESGTPTHYYILDGETVFSYPSGGTLRVQHFPPASTLSGTQVPGSPVRFHGVIVDMAVQRAYRDADDHDAAAALQAEVERQVNNMRNALLIEHVDGPQGYVQHRAGWN